MKKRLLTALLLSCSGCSITIVYSLKSSSVRGKDNNVYISGSHLKGNKMDGSADGNKPAITIPMK